MQAKIEGRRVSAVGLPERQSEPPKGYSSQVFCRSRVAVRLAGALVLILAGLPRATAKSSADPDAELSLRVYNYAHIDRGILSQAENVTGAIFENLGIRLVWSDCPASPALIHAYPNCPTDLGMGDLVLRILPNSMAAKLPGSDETLGFAYPCPDNEPACELNVAYQHVDEVVAYGYRADRVLGYVIAHEIAHALIGPGHSSEGIMRAQWSRDDLERMRWGLRLEFTSEQSMRLRSAVLRRRKASLLAKGG
jgi:hypothetical protein